jgi:hypothetical protein
LPVVPYLSELSGKEIPLSKYVHCDFGALFTAILTVSTLAVIVPAKPSPVLQRAMSALPTSILVCSQTLDRPVSSFSAAVFQDSSENQYQSLAERIGGNP